MLKYTEAQTTVSVYCHAILDEAPDADETLIFVGPGPQSRIRDISFPFVGLSKPT